LKGVGGFLLVVLVGCRSDAHTTILPPLVQHMIDDGVAPDTDLVEVWVCRVPATTTAPIYGDLPLRLPLVPQQIVDSIGDRVAAYWRTLSGDRYEMSFAAGGTITLSDDDDDEDCISQALDRSSPTATVVLAIADAEHGEGHPGGRGRQGNAPNCDGCAAAATRRGVSMGASDFHPDWGPVPLLDLIEHELGHTLGLPHSGATVSVADPYSSALDVMSDSAAPRTADPSRRDGPSTLAINLVDLGWLAPEDVVVLDPAQGTRDGEIELAAATSMSGTRVAVLEVDEHRVLTVELRIAIGFDAHLPTSGVAVHLIDDTTGAGISRLQLPLGSAPPHTDLLRAGDSLVSNGWTIHVREVGATARLAITPTDG
jgi:hypothetical protein